MHFCRSSWQETEVIHESIQNHRCNSPALAKFLNRPIQLRSVVEDYDYWCVVLENEYLSVAELRPLLCEISATLEDFPDLFPDHSDRTRSFSMELSRALLQHAMHASWRYEHLTEDYLMLIDVDISMDNTMMNGEKYYG